MSLLGNIDHLAQTSGIMSVCVQADHLEYRGDESWYGTLERALDLRKLTQEPTIRFIAGKNSIIVQKIDDETVGVVIAISHPTCKSLRRMIRRMAMKDRGPIPGIKKGEAPDCVIVVDDPPALDPNCTCDSGNMEGDAL